MDLTSDTLKCFRFVTDDLRSHHGDVQWTVEEWMTTPDAPSVGFSGFHASQTARDSLRHVYGTRWFLAEARGRLDEADDQVAAGEMRLIREIPADVLRRFALLCATDCLPYLRDPELRDWAQASLRSAAERLDGRAGQDASSGEIAIPGIPAGAAASRTVAAVAAAAAAVRASSGAPAWAGAAVSAAHAAHVGAAAARAVDELATATASIGNVASGATASRLADRAAMLTRTAAAAGAAAHAASVEAATGRLPIDSASDPHYSGWRAWAVPIKDESYKTQASTLNALLDG